MERTMAVFDHYKVVSSWSAAKIEAFMKEHDQAEYNLVDVRQPIEYEQGHLSGATLIPVVELESSLNELSPDKPTVVYCASGMRSRAAAAMLVHAGFKEVHHMEGGMDAWEGAMAEGMPEEIRVLFGSAKSPLEYIALAWQLEDGAIRFYSGLAVLTDDKEAAAMFEQMIRDEERHKLMLTKLYRETKGIDAAAGIEESITGNLEVGDTTEGGLSISEWLEWAKDKEARRIVELCVTMEANAYDRYLYMNKITEDEHVKAVFAALSSHEKRHLETLTEYFEKLLARTAR